MPLFLVTPSSVGVEAIDDFRQEFINAAVKIHGCYGLRRSANAGDWFQRFVYQNDGQTLQYFSWSTIFQQYVGCIRLNPVVPSHMLFNFGLNIGYSIRPSLWNKGLGTLQLKEGLNVLRDLGLKQCGIGADLGSASARVIEKCGGVFQYAIHGLGAYKIEIGQDNGED